MQDPSLVVVPYRYKATKLYSEIPISGIGDFTVGRLLDTATRVNSNGNIEVVNANIPRLDYYTTGGTAGCPALLVEPSAQNLATYSEDWTNYWSTALNVTWSTGNVTGTTDPYGTNVADAMFETSATDNHATFADYSVVNGTTYTFSFFVKPIIARNVRINGSANFPQQTTDVNLSTLAISGVGSGTCRVLNFGNGWARVSQTYTATGSGNGRLIIYSMSGTTQSFQGSTNNGLYFFGAQLETGSVATSYIPTTTAPITRNADVISVSGAVSGCIGQTEGTIYAEVDSRNQQAGRIVSFQIAGTAGSGQIRIDTVGAALRCRLINASGTSVFDVTSSPSMSLGINKMAFAFNAAASGIVVALNGTIITTGTAAGSTVHNATQLTIGGQDSIAGFSSFYNDRIRSLAIYTTRLTNAELQSLTTL